MTTDRATPLAITGRGLVCAAGRGIAAYEAALDARRCCVLPLPDAVAAGLTTLRGGRIPDLALDTAPGHERVLTACRHALTDALAEANIRAGARIGLALGTALGEMERFASAPELTQLLPHALTRQLCSDLRLDGPATTFSVTCTSALYAVEQASLDLAMGRADAMVVLGVDGLSRFMQAGFSTLGALARDETGTFPTDGILLGEAACAVVLELQTEARRPLAWLCGQGTTADGTHLTSPDTAGAGMVRAIGDALRRAGRQPGDVGTVTLSAVGSPAYQSLYGAALPAVFGACGALPAEQTWEAEVGHVLAASGALGLAHAVRELGQRPGDVLALTVGFGGQNGASLVRRSAL